MKTRRFLQMLIAATFVLSLTPVAPLAPATGTAAQGTSRTFPETGKTVRGPFLRYWETHGGLAQQGFPISDEMQERSDVDGKTYTVQYFERAVFELHPELAGTPHEVLLSLLGVWQYGALYGTSGAPNQRTNTAAGSVLFTQTGKRVGGIFLQYWQAKGGLPQQGYPISDEFTELSAIDGKPYTVQYFERAVFERHPENAGKPSEVLLSQLGRYRYNVLYSSPQLPRAEGSRAQVNLIASDLFLAWREVETGDTNPDPEYRPTFRIRAMDLRTGRAFAVATTYNEFSKPAISGSLIAWASENKDCPECDMDVYARDLATGATTLVASGPQLQPRIQHAPLVSGRMVAWIEQYGNARSVVLAKIENNRPVQTQTIARFESGPTMYAIDIALNERYLAWSSSRGEGQGFAIKVGVLNFETGTQSTLIDEENAYPIESIDLAGEILVVNEYHITLLNIRKGEHLIYSEGRRIYTSGDDELVVDEDTVAWTERDTSNNPTRSRLKVATVTQADNQPVEVDTGAIRDPAISGDRLFYIKNGKLTSKRIAEVLGVK